MGRYHEKYRKKLKGGRWCRPVVEIGAEAHRFVQVGARVGWRGGRAPTGGVAGGQRPRVAWRGGRAPAGGVAGGQRPRVGWRGGRAPAVKNDLTLGAAFRRRPPTALSRGPLGLTARCVRRRYLRAAAIRTRAASTFSRELNALIRTCPSPHWPKPAPGVQTTWALLSSVSKNAHESRPVLIQM